MLTCSFTHARADIYISVVSSSHNVCAKGKFVAIASTTVETNNPEAELKAAFDLMGPIIEKYAPLPIRSACTSADRLLLVGVHLDGALTFTRFLGCQVHLGVAHAGAHR